jgi:predicted MFS family arabinose efflux permease
LNALVQWRSGSALTATLLIAVAMLALLGFVAWQHRLLRPSALDLAQPLVRLDLFRNPRFTVGCVVAFLYGVVLFGSTYLLPVFMQLALGMSAAQSGWTLLPAGVALAATIGVVGRLLDRAPHLPFASLGFGLLAASLALMLTVGLDSAWLVLATGVLLGRIGLGLILPAMHFSTLRGVDEDLISQASSLANFMRVLGGAVGVSLCGIVLEWRIATHGDSLKITTGTAPRLAAFNESFLLLAAVCVLAGAAAWRLRPPRRSGNKM